MFLRKIKDIRISKKRIAVIRDADISVAEIEDQIRKVIYAPAKDEKRQESENAKVPPFIQVFYYLFFSYLKIPSESEFWETYLTWVGGENASGFIQIGEDIFPTKGLRDRLNRTYPSLIRDLHFLYLLDESGSFKQVDYSMDRDYFSGLDLRINNGDMEIFVSLFINTSRSRYFKRKKTTRHDYSKVHEVEFIVDFDSLTKLGSIYVLNDGHVQLLKKIIDEIK